MLSESKSVLMEVSEGEYTCYTAKKAQQTSLPLILVFITFLVKEQNSESCSQHKYEAVMSWIQILGCTQWWQDIKPYLLIGHILFYSLQRWRKSIHALVSFIEVWKTRSLILIFWKASKIKSISYLRTLRILMLPVSHLCFLVLGCTPRSGRGIGGRCSHCHHCCSHLHYGHHHRWN